MSKVIIHRIANAGSKSEETYEDAYVDEKDMTNDAFLVIRATSTGLISNMIPRSYILRVEFEE